MPKSIPQGLLALIACLGDEHPFKIVLNYGGNADGNPKKSNGPGSWNADLIMNQHVKFNPDDSITIETYNEHLSPILREMVEIWNQRRIPRSSTDSVA